MTCDECSNINHFKYKYCCLHECGEHIFCLGCENVNKNKDLSGCIPLTIEDIIRVEI